jgi:hypothetical protein
MILMAMMRMALIFSGYKLVLHWKGVKEGITHQARSSIVCLE